MLTIYRKELNGGLNTIKLPMGAKVLRTAMSLAESGKEVVSIWYQCDTENGLEDRRFVVYGTGADMSEIEGYIKDYIGTAFKSNRYAFHVYEVEKEY